METKIYEDIANILIKDENRSVLARIVYHIRSFYRIRSEKQTDNQEIAKRVERYFKIFHPNKVIEISNTDVMDHLRDLNQLKKKNRGYLDTAKVYLAFLNCEHNQEFKKIRIYDVKLSSDLKRLSVEFVDDSPLDVNNSVDEKPKLLPREANIDKKRNAEIPASTWLAQRKTEFDQRANEILADYEAHLLVEKFHDWLKSQGSLAEGAYWCLKAGPGMGKSAIMAHIKREYEERDPNTCCIYFSFRAGRADSNFSDFYKYVLARIFDSYGGGSAIPDNEIERRDLFRSTIFDQSRHKKFQSMRLVLVVDALDEMMRSERAFVDISNPLEWPEILPPGVFIAFSQRQEPGEDVQGAPFARNLCVVALDLNDPKGEAATAHIQTVKNYTDKVCRAKTYIKQYHQRAQDDSTQDDFVAEICGQAKYNFMLLRAVLNDEDYWRDMGGRPLPGTLTTYYHDHFNRMLGFEAAGFNKYALLCFALRPEISNFTFLRLMDGALADKVRTEPTVSAKNALEQWIRQGLIIRKKRGGQHWFSAYHNTFRDFLAARLEDEDENDFAARFGFGLARSQKLDGGLAYVRTRQPEIIQDWIAMVLELLIKTENAPALSEILRDLDFWVACSKCPDGVGTALDALKRVQPSDLNLDEFDDLFRESAEKLVEWVKMNRVEPAKNRSYGLGSLYQMALNSDFAMRFDREILRYPQYVLSVKLQVENTAPDKIPQIEHLMADMKAARRKNEVDAAFAISDEIESLLASDGDKVYWSRLLYDRGMLLHTIGQYEKAMLKFHESSLCAYDGNDTVRGLFSTYRYELGRYLNYEISDRAAHDTLANIYDTCLTHEAKYGPTFMSQNTLYNVAVSASHLAFEFQSYRFENWYAALIDHKLSKDSAKAPNEIYEFYRYQAMARHHMLQGRYAEAAAIFSHYLCFEIPELEGYLTIDIEPLLLEKIQKTAINEIVEIGRDYRDLAKAIMKSSELKSDKLVYANKVWERGLAMPDTLGNRRFLADMKNDVVQYGASLN